MLYALVVVAPGYLCAFGGRQRFCVVWEREAPMRAFAAYIGGLALNVILAYI